MKIVSVTEGRATKILSENIISVQQSSNSSIKSTNNQNFTQYPVTRSVINNTETDIEKYNIYDDIEKLLLLFKQDKNLSIADGVNVSVNAAVTYRDFAMEMYQNASHLQTIDIGHSTVDAKTITQIARQKDTQRIKPIRYTSSSTQQSAKKQLLKHQQYDGKV